MRPGMTGNPGDGNYGFVYRYRGAYLGFPTSVRRNPVGGRKRERSIPKASSNLFRDRRRRCSEATDMVHVDTGASYRHPADIQRNVPVGGKFSPEQRRLLRDCAQCTENRDIAHQARATWWELHNLAVQMLKDAGGLDTYYTYGIGHYIGMEVHDEGDYDQPMRLGMVLSIEQGVAPPDGPRVAFEDNVIVTPDGHDWISRPIPIEAAEVEAMAAKPSNIEGS